jgi:hypothetical protein
MAQESEGNPGDEHEEYDEDSFVADVSPHRGVLKAEILQNLVLAVDDDVTPLELIYHEGPPSVLQPVDVGKPVNEHTEVSALSFCLGWQGKFAGLHCDIKSY